MQGTITAVQRMSIHDGPGIRTTLYFKGCNLRCAWCHNPETWSPGPQLQYIAEKCRHCAHCVAACEKGTLSFENGQLSLPCEEASHCTRCVEACSAGALLQVGRRIEAAQAVRELLQDRIYYETSQGGITLSGGEPLLQAHFAAEVLAACLQAGVHTAVESNLAVPWHTIEGLLPLVKLWMCDLKLASPEKHLRWTGRDNRQILHNLRQLAATGTPLVIRTPIVPGVNDSQEEVEALCRIIAGLKGDIRYELLGFHTLGFGKYTELGLENPLSETKPLHPHTLTHLQTIPAQFGLASH